VRRHRAALSRTRLHPSNDRMGGWDGDRPDWGMNERMRGRLRRETTLRGAGSNERGRELIDERVRSRRR